jgi:hypothetical protein
MTSFPVIRFLIPLLLAAGVHLCAADLNVLQSTVVDSSALNFSSASANFSQNVNGRTYQRSPMSTFKGYQYVTYYDGNRNVCLARRKLPDGAWQIIRFTDYTIDSSDSHNVVALGICAADGTIHLAFDHHADPLNYRVSAVGAASDPESVAWSTSLFGPVTDKLGSLPRLTSVTYPSFFNAPNGNLMLYFRFQGSGSGDGMIHEYDGTTHDWTGGMGKFIARTGSYTGAVSTNSTTRNPYINGISYGGNRLHASWGWRENSGGAQFNHDLNYAYSDDNGRTWNNSAGTQIGTTNSSFITIDSPGLLVASIPQNIGLSNQYTHYAYPDSSCHVIVAHHQSGTTTTRYHHYWRNASGTWSSQALPFSGSRPKLVGDDNRELFLAYVSGSTLRVAKGTPNAAQTSWSWSDIHSQTGRTEGGEGQIDFTRWEAERILSAYGQVAPNSAGDPTALGIFDYQVSAKAILPVPVDGDSEVARTSALTWTAGIGATAHRIYLGTDPVAVAAATTTSPEYKGQQTSAFFTPAQALAPATTYYWRIDEVDASAQVEKGFVWSFSTVPNGAPSISLFSNQTIPLGNPVPALPFIISDDATDPDALVFSSSSSNPALVPTAGITFSGTGSNRELQLTPTAGETGTSVITIGVSDGTDTTETSFTLTVFDPGPEYTVYSGAMDASIRENLAVVDVTSPSTLLGTGGNNPWVDRCTVYVFQLPDFGPLAAPFTSASLTFSYSAKENTLQNNDLYGLGSRNLPDVLGGDYYGQTPGPDPSDATLLQSSILVNSTPLGLITTSPAGGDALRDYLNAQYDSGAGAGQFVFLRLNTAGAKDGIDRATLTMSEGGTSEPIDTRPRLSFTTPAPLNHQQQWREAYFGTPFATGLAADQEDPNADGENNLLEFATGQNPHANTLAETTVALNGSDLAFCYARGLAAIADGIQFDVEWSDTLPAGSWSTDGIADVIDPEIPADDLRQYRLATLPAGTSGRRFVHLKVTAPENPNQTSPNP